MSVSVDLVQMLFNYVTNGAHFISNIFVKNQMAT